MYRSTSLGRRVEVYSANGVGGSSALGCLSSPIVWAVGVLCCLAAPLACLWSQRFKEAIYHAQFHVIFADVQGAIMAYNQGQGAALNSDIAPVLMRQYQSHGPSAV